MKKKCQVYWITSQSIRCLTLVTISLLASSQQTQLYSSEDIASLLSSLPTVMKYGGESKVSRRSPLNLGYVIGIDNGHSVESHLSKVPHMLDKAQAHSISPSLAHALVSHDTQPMLSHSSKYVAHDLTVSHATAHHSITKVVSVGKTAPLRELNHGPVSGLEDVTHALVPTITHVTTTTVSEHGVTKSPTVTVLDHSLVPVTELGHKASQSKQSSVTVTPESLTKTTFTVNHGAANHDHIETTVTEHAKGPLLHALDPHDVTHTVVHKVSTLTHDPDPVLTHDVSVTHITNGVVLAPIVSHKPQTPVHQNVFRTHYGGFGVGVDFGGHGSGHGFFA